MPKLRESKRALSSPQHLECQVEKLKIQLILDQLCANFIFLQDVSFESLIMIIVHDLAVVIFHSSVGISFSFVISDFVILKGAQEMVNYHH